MELRVVPVRKFLACRPCACDRRRFAVLTAKKFGEFFFAVLGVAEIVRPNLVALPQFVRDVIKKRTKRLVIAGVSGQVFLKVLGG